MSFACSRALAYYCLYIYMYLCSISCYEILQRLSFAQRLPYQGPNGEFHTNRATLTTHRRCLFQDTEAMPLLGHSSHATLGYSNYVTLGNTNHAIIRTQTMPLLRHKDHVITWTHKPSHYQDTQTIPLLGHTNYSTTATHKPCHFQDTQTMPLLRYTINATTRTQ